jgi:hypothetical protein
MKDISARPSALFGESFALLPNQGSSNVPQYRAYIIGSDGEFKNSVPLECADDAVARKKGRQLLDGHHVELWQLTRKIATFDHKPRGMFRA